MWTYWMAGPRAAAPPGYAPVTSQQMVSLEKVVFLFRELLKTGEFTLGASVSV